MKRCCALGLCLLLLCLCACGGPESYTAETFAFDTVITLTARCGSAEEFQQLRQVVFDRFQQLHRLFDIYQEYEGMNNLCTVNRLAGQPVAVEEEILSLLALSQEICRQTGGLVNVAQGRLYSLWREARETGILPTGEAIRAAMEHGDADCLVLGEGTVTLTDPEMTLDVGAVAKGWAAQAAAEAADAAGFTDYVISAGGNVVTRGHARGGRAWRVGIRDPRSESSGDHVAVVEAEELAVVTSGGYERQLVVDGKCYCHIIDPRTGYPADFVLSATAVCENSALADGYSTALFLMTPEEGLAFARERGFRALVVDRQGTVRDTGAETKKTG